MPKSIYDLVSHKNVAAYYETKNEGSTPRIGETLFPIKKQLGLSLEYIKGASGKVQLLEPSAFDVQSTIRDRISVTSIATEMAFFKESMMLKENDRQQLNILLSSNNQQAVDTVLKNVLDDKSTLITGAEARLEMMRMQLLATGKIQLASNGANYDYDYGFLESNKDELVGTSAWSDTENSTPLDDIFRWIDTLRSNTGVTPKRAICNDKTAQILSRNKQVKAEIGRTSFVPIREVVELIKFLFDLELIIVSDVFETKNGEVKPMFADNTFTLLPGSNLGNTYLGTTPEESDLMGQSNSDVSLVKQGIAVTTIKEKDPVTVSTKVSMVTLPSFEASDKCFIAKVS